MLSIHCVFLIEWNFFFEIRSRRYVGRTACLKVKIIKEILHHAKHSSISQQNSISFNLQKKDAIAWKFLLRRFWYFRHVKLPDQVKTKMYMYKKRLFCLQRNKLCISYANACKLICIRRLLHLKRFSLFNNMDLHIKTTTSFMFRHSKHFLINIRSKNVKSIGNCRISLYVNPLGRKVKNNFISWRNVTFDCHLNLTIFKFILNFTSFRFTYELYQSDVSLLVYHGVKNSRRT